ncbi:hypothetical protein B296_00004925 [Ensete ventricosum]|uniref:Uncharacterized protein n=1 Tax=Ensete ventricosum TaxID=4639 RepID=A0A427B5A8_ENSVE|nr:hypothetical protein B296_00004925 [Ensete ventricosum]
MAVPSLELHSEGETDRHPLLMDRAATSDGHEHIIDVPRGINGDEDNLFSESHSLDRNSANTTPHVLQASPVSPDAANSRNTSLIRRGDNYGRRGRSPLNSGLWISVELVVNVSQIIAAIIVLSLSRDEHPQSPLFEWIIGYTIGCFANLPHLYWRYIHRNGQGSLQESDRSNQRTTYYNPPESSAYTTSFVTQASGPESDNAIAPIAQVRQDTVTNTRYCFMKYLYVQCKCLFTCFKFFGFCALSLLV